MFAFGPVSSCAAPARRGAIAVFRARSLSASGKASFSLSAGAFSVSGMGGASRIARDQPRHCPVSDRGGERNVLLRRGGTLGLARGAAFGVLDLVPHMRA